MNTWKVILATLVIFGCGVLTGALIVDGHHANSARAGERAANGQKTAVPAWQRLEFLRKASKHLDLTPAQQERVEKILRDSQDRTKQIWDRIAPQMREELHKVRESIRAELTPEQEKKFELLIKGHPSKKSEEAASEEKRRRLSQPTVETLGSPTSASNLLPPSTNSSAK